MNDIQEGYSEELKFLTSISPCSIPLNMVWLILNLKETIKKELLLPEDEWDYLLYHIEKRITMDWNHNQSWQSESAVRTWQSVRSNIWQSVHQSSILVRIKSSNPLHSTVYCTCNIRLNEKTKIFVVAWTRALFPYDVFCKIKNICFTFYWPKFPILYTCS